MNLDDAIWGQRPANRWLRLRGLMLATALAVSVGATARVESEAADPWEGFTCELTRAGEVVRREQTPTDAIPRAEGDRYLARLIRMGLETTLEFADPSRPHLFPAATWSMQAGGNTADALYVHGFIVGSRTYRIRGESADEQGDAS